MSDDPIRRIRTLTWAALEQAAEEMGRQASEISRLRAENMLLRNRMDRARQWLDIYKTRQPVTNELATALIDAIDKALK